jgi:hypothetical protein
VAYMYCLFSNDVHHVELCASVCVVMCVPRALCGSRVVAACITASGIADAPGKFQASVGGN